MCECVCVSVSVQCQTVGRFDHRAPVTSSYLSFVVGNT